LSSNVEQVRQPQSDAVQSASVSLPQSSGVEQVCQRQSDAVQSASVSLPSSSGVEQVHQLQSDAVQSASVSLPLSSGVEQVRQIQTRDEQTDNISRLRHSRRCQSVKEAKPQVLVELQNHVGVKGRGKRAGRKKRKQQSTAVKGRKKKKLENVAGCIELHCLICGEDFTEPPTETWLQCQSCEGWRHESCTAEGEDADSFVCDLCTPDNGSF